MKVNVGKLSEAFLVFAVFTTHQPLSSEFEELPAVLHEVLNQHNLCVCSRYERTHLNVFGETASACSERARDLGWTFFEL